MLKIILTNQFFHNLTGSEMSCFELSKQLMLQGHNVTIMAEDFGKPMTEMASGIDLCHVDNMLEYKPDVLHLCHAPVSTKVLKRFPNTPAIQHIRSEVIPVFEVPIIHPNIKKYISIRPSITEYIKTFGIPQEMIEEVPNPFDTSRFNTDYDFEENERERILFVGTMDYLRKEMLYDVAKLCKKTNRELWIVGADSGGYLFNLNKQCDVNYFRVRKDVENFYKICDYTVGIFDGRTTIEGWLCGVPAWVYKVDRSGKIISKKLVDVPDDIEKYSAEASTNKIIEIYGRI